MLSRITDLKKYTGASQTWVLLIFQMGDRMIHYVWRARTRFSTFVIIGGRKLLCSSRLCYQRWTLFEIWPSMLSWYISCCFWLTIFHFFWASFRSLFIQKIPFRLMKRNFLWQENKEEMDFKQQEDIIFKPAWKGEMHSAKIIALCFPSTKERELYH